MKRTLSVVVLLLLGIAVVLGAERLDRARSDAQAMADVSRQLDDRALRLQADLRALQDLNGQLASALAAEPGAEDGPFSRMAPRMAQERPDIRSIVFVRKLRIERVYPIAGNEPILGLDYSLRPQFMAKITHMIRHRVPVIDGSTRLVQTGRTGLIFRMPIFDAAQGDDRDYRGMTALTVDLEETLRRAGLLGAEAGFDVAIRSREAAQPLYGLFGDGRLFEQPHAAAVIELPDAVWELAAVPKKGLADDSARLADPGRRGRRDAGSGAGGALSQRRLAMSPAGPPGWPGVPAHAVAGRHFGADAADGRPGGLAGVHGFDRGRPGS
ncbi:CHASE domain-containing protein [Castellaniella ginsengisoli]|uniref:CHASE domain-containing protein n=1 Tax=Castellaniella ginsengisoli TaxID=546114 RepID=A0AB39CKJ5_9BURK